ncbi:DNA-binding IclR family transcriptional regulator [Rhodococcus sp. LBL1]|nr:DNA-binding IclR family transcriptional regulator [Rhodococcus sp. LBL1]MDH6681608.1 DNA-binding IclR family transcriptional regulator [Rhodococcus sp. LBL2]
MVVIDMSSAGSRRGPTGSVTVRALNLLEVFSPDQPVLTLSEMSRLTGFPLTTVHRLAADLTAWGALERDGSGRYRIGLRLWEVASLAPRGTMLRELAMPVMEDLSQITQENVQLGVREGTEIIFLERIGGKRAVPVRTRVGGRFPIHASSIGLALLAFAPTVVQDEVLSRPLERFTEKTITSADELRRTLAEVRKRELAISDRQVTMDALSVAAPIFSRPGVVAAAIAIVVNAETAQTTALSQMVRAAARSIGRALQPGGLTARGQVGGLSR